MHFSFTNRPHTRAQTWRRAMCDTQMKEIHSPVNNTPLSEENGLLKISLLAVSSMLETPSLHNKKNYKIKNKKK
jgi:hypothetical protein